MKTDTLGFDAPSDDAIAVIGMAGRFPGANTLDEFWENLEQGRDTIKHFSIDELRIAGVPEKLLHDPRYVRARGVLNNIEQFDAAFFDITPYEARITDPQHRLFIEMCWEALEVAGYAAKKHQQLIGVYAGMSDNTYLEYCLSCDPEFLSTHYAYQTHIANSSHFLATKVSYHLNLTGPSLNIHTACSTSLVSIVKACQALNLGECDIALAGGVSVRVPQMSGYLYKEGAILSQDGKCRAFDKEASGTVSANAVGVVVLKRLSEAIRDGDSIQAVVRSFAINNDGAAKAGYAAPSVLEQSRCIATALADIDVESVSYIEAHGTGTSLGDPIEVAALTKAFRYYTKKNNFCAIGSVKTNIGHADTAAGVVGFIKTVLSLQHKVIPSSLHFKEPNSQIDFSQSPFYVNNKRQEWHSDYPVRRAGVSSFGIGGTNAHIILEEAPVLKKSSDPRSLKVILLSAKTPSALKKQQDQLLNYLLAKRPDDRLLADIAYTLQIGRQEFSCRRAFVCSNTNELIRILESEGNFPAPSNSLEYEIAQRWMSQASIDWKNYYKDENRHKVPLPTYPFEKLSYWVEPQVKTNRIAPSPDYYIYKTHWELSSFPKNPVFLADKSWLVFTDQWGFAERIASELMKKNQRVVYITKGDSFKKHDATHYQINPAEKDNYQQLYTALGQSNHLPTHVLHSWSLSDVNSAGEPTSWEELQIEGFLSLVCFAQTFLTTSGKEPIDITILTNGSRAVVTSDIVIPEKATLLGACLVIPQEHKALCRVIDVDINDLAISTGVHLINPLLSELASRPHEAFIAYRHGLRFIPGFKITSDDKALAGKGFLKREGTYLITGGLGKIGIELAEFLAENYTANLILVSRRAIPSQERWHQYLLKEPQGQYAEIIARLQRLQKKASFLWIVQADISNYDQMYHLFKCFQDKFSLLNGVFHLAAIANTSARVLVKDLEHNEVYRQFLPKIQGMKVIQSLADEFSVEACISYSSIATVVGGIGLAAYSASNCYLDSIINQQNKVSKTRYLCLNWDAWNFSSPQNNLLNTKQSSAKNMLLPNEAMRILGMCASYEEEKQFIVSTSPLENRVSEWVNQSNNKTDKVKSEFFSHNEPHAISKNEIENTVENIFESCLEIKSIDKNQSLYDLGGDSLSAIRLLEMLEQTFSVKIKLSELVTNGSINSISEIIGKYSAHNQYSSLVKLRDTGKGNPLFFVHPLGGTVFCYLELVRHLQIQNDRPVYALQDIGIESGKTEFASIEEMAKRYLQEIQEIQPTGPYVIGGYSFGSSVAFEIARQFENRGEKVDCLFLIDGWAAFSKEIQHYDRFLEAMERTLEEVENLLSDDINNKSWILELAWSRMQLLLHYMPVKIESPIVLFKAKDILPEYQAVDEVTNHWQQFTAHPIQVHTIIGNHNTLLKIPGVNEISNVINEIINNLTITTDKGGLPHVLESIQKSAVF